MFSDWDVIDVQGNMLVDQVPEEMCGRRHVGVGGLILGGLSFNTANAERKKIIPLIRGSLQIVNAVYLLQFVGYNQLTDNDIPLPRLRASLISEASIG
jgi:hypothetical protein